MRISLIVAMDENRGIGNDNRLPWRLPSDLKRFKALTMGHHLIMGRKTLESIGKILPGRTSIVLSRQSNYQPDGCLVASSLKDALAIAQDHGEDEVFIIGGGEIFASAVPQADRIYLTLVHATFPCDTFFPDFPMEDWLKKEDEFVPADAQNPFPSTFVILDRNFSSSVP
jgi:dihydrofolate reductase